uniref:Epithelial cell transforming 2 like n=1 Tax=Paramormyrops kingsleyae TaxID=1676925 RepID=A0A3B3RR88_9TELE
LFQERTTLILHWFDLWTDNQRKQFIHDILRRCSRSQLFTRDWFMDAFPSTNMDFTSVLPRFLSLYILSFLNPRELCIVSQVCWHWKFLAEQDCLWAPKCIKRGWFLPFTPTDLEYGAWKRHYIVCVSSLDYLTPREAADIYGTLNDPIQDKEELEERRKERWIRQCIREKAAEHKLLLSAARSAVVPLLYDHRGSTLEALLFRVERLLQGVMVQSVAVLAEGDAEELDLLQCRVTQKSVLRPDVRQFWERLAGWVSPPTQGASLFIFTPLAASTGTELMVKLSTLTGLTVCAPTGLATGSYQQLSEWSGGAEFPPRLYFGEAELLSWARQAERLEETLDTIRVQLGPQLKALSQEIRGRAIELLHSEKVYIRLLQAIVWVYFGPLKAALDSNRAILSSSKLLTIFSPVLEILEINVFLEELMARLQDQGPVQHVGDVCLKLCSKLRAYTNFFNNYPTVLRTIDRCREMIPTFRAFLRRHDRTLATSMLLQELLLLPSSRIEEYLTLFQAAFLHTAPEHPDSSHLSSVLEVLRSYRVFLRKQLKQHADGDSKILETQRMIQSCPSLQEGNRRLITSQEAALLSIPDYDIAAPLVYEQVDDLGLFLFNDALVLTRRSVAHLPFWHGCKTSHTFLASVALRVLTLRDITDTKVKNAFVLESPKRQWICATDTEEEKVSWLSALQGAV